MEERTRWINLASRGFREEESPVEGAGLSTEAEVIVAAESAAGGEEEAPAPAAGVAMM